MDSNLQQAKRDIRAFFPNYSDERLAWLLAHARDGKLVYTSCCCFIGVATADHELQSLSVMEVYSRDSGSTGHLSKATRLPHALQAEHAFRALAYTDAGQFINRDGVRRRRLIPMIKAEMRRRERARKNVEALESSLVAA